jgi:hypothetical protein
MDDGLNQFFLGRKIFVDGFFTHSQALDRASTVKDRTPELATDSNPSSRICLLVLYID